MRSRAAGTWKTELHSDNPGAASHWAGEIVGLLASILAQAPEAPALLSLSQPRSALAPPVSELIMRLGAAQSLMIEQCADLADADVFLARERLALSVAGRRAFLAALISEVVAAHALLGRRADGDYSPDLRPQRFPEWRAPNAKTRGGGLSALKLYSAWAKANEV
jgi:hypothetical protein